MSSRKGGVKRKPAHQNKFAYKHNPKSKKTQKILASPVSGLCAHCTEIIEWRKQYRKYKPLTAPRRCQVCEQKTIKQAYHNLCEPCSKKDGLCAKCRKPWDADNRDSGDDMAVKYSRDDKAGNSDAEDESNDDGPSDPSGRLRKTASPGAQGGGSCNQEEKAGKSKAEEQANV
mmetsp:Transcript_9641/g.27037  ORF Transcript_9641/g.27037 Transcript_9641/m.27037 type:complete len:173 (-) Transcript_9641:1857-2375(-)